MLAVWSIGTGPVFSEELLWTQPSTELPDWVRHEVIYEINVRQYSEAGTFAAVEAGLGRIEGVGVKSLWFMPIHPIGGMKRKGGLGSYYSIQDYPGVKPGVCTQAGLQAPVGAAQGRGKKNIL
ncbi:MAG: alpha-amylase, partial [Puniceicoccaceae bacterium]